MLERRLYVIVEMSVMYGSLLASEMFREDLVDVLDKYFKENVAEWADEFIELMEDLPWDVYRVNREQYDTEVWTFTMEKFKEEDWLRPDFKDRETIKAIVKDAGFSMSRKTIDMILDGRISGDIVISTPEDFIENAKEYYADRYDYGTEDFWEMFGIDLGSWSELEFQLSLGNCGPIGMGNIYNGVYKGSPYVIEIVQ